MTDDLREIQRLRAILTEIRDTARCSNGGTVWVGDRETSLAEFIAMHLDPPFRVRIER